ncbi:MAG: DUF5076 domain-containing protein [Planctomycetaceae bacterium]
MKDNRRPLIMPTAAEADMNAVEMARIWLAQNKLHCVLNIGHWKETSGIDERNAWGIVLADIARHVSLALEDSTGTDSRENLKMIFKSFQSELAHKTSEHAGEWPEGRP